MEVQGVSLKKVGLIGFETKLCRLKCRAKILNQASHSPMWWSILNSKGCILKILLPRSSISIKVCYKLNLTSTNIKTQESLDKKFDTIKCSWSSNIASEYS